MMPNKSFMLSKRLNSFLFIAAILMNAANGQVVKTDSLSDTINRNLRGKQTCFRSSTFLPHAD
jgi:hypothetical protein